MLYFQHVYKKKRFCTIIPLYVRCLWEWLVLLTGFRYQLTSRQAFLLGAFKVLRAYIDGILRNME